MHTYIHIGYVFMLASCYYDFSGFCKYSVDVEAQSG